MFSALVHRQLYVPATLSHYTVQSPIDVDDLRISHAKNVIHARASFTWAKLVRHRASVASISASSAGADKGEKPVPAIRSMT